MLDKDRLKIIVDGIGVGVRNWIDVSILGML